jgi:biopolymer transport protein ExbD
MRMRRHSRNAHDEDSHGIDLAPMLDFVLNLLIFFIITAVFVKESGMELNRPSGAADQVAEGGGSIPILVLEDGGVVVDGRPVDLRAVQANINRLHAVNPNKGVLVIADQDAQTGVVATVIDQVRLGGIYNITFSTSS